MTRYIYWSGHRYPVGTTFYLYGEDEHITLIDVVQGDVLNAVIEGTWTNGPMVMSAASFGYLVETKGFIPFDPPLYQIGDRFVHHLNNNTLEVKSVGARPSDPTGELMYFMSGKMENGKVYNIAIAEAYLQKLIKLDSASSIDLPSIPIDAELPDVRMEDTY